MHPSGVLAGPSTAAVSIRHPYVGFPPFLSLSPFCFLASPHKLSALKLCLRLPFPPPHPIVLWSGYRQKPSNRKWQIQCSHISELHGTLEAPLEEHIVVERALSSSVVSTLAKKVYSVLKTQFHGVPCPPGPALLTPCCPPFLGSFPPGLPFRALSEHVQIKGQRAPMIVLNPQETAAPIFHFHL